MGQESSAKRRKLTDELGKDYAIITDRWYRDNDIHDYLTTVINKEINGYATEDINTCSYLLQGVVDGCFPDNDGNHYFVLYTPAISSLDKAEPFDKSKQPAPVRDPDNRKDIFDELLPLLAPNNDCHIKILFAYNPSENHWLTGEVQVHKLGAVCSVLVYAHNPYGKGKMSTGDFEKLKAIFEKKIGKKIIIENKESPYAGRQAKDDGSSCGVIVADEIKKRITGAALTVSTAHPIGAEELRKQQLETIIEHLDENNATRQNFIARNTRNNSENRSDNNKFKNERKTIDRIKNEELKKLVLENLSVFKERYSILIENLNDAVTNNVALDSRKDIEGFIVSNKAEIEKLNSDVHSKRLALSVMDSLHGHLPPEPSPNVRASAVGDSADITEGLQNKLRLEQKILIEQPSIVKKFTDTLNAIGKQAKHEQQIPNGVFICYAWPDAADEQEQHLAWVQPFLIGLRKHLHDAGIHLAKLDIKDNPPGGNIYEYMEGARTADYVLIIGTESLLNKHKKGISAVCTELNNSKRKRAEDIKKNKYAVIPILLSGDYQQSFPSYFELYTTIKDWRGTKSYYQHFKWLLTVLYSCNETAFDEHWQSFEQQLTDEERVIIEGLDQQAVLDHLRQEKNAQAARQKLNGIHSASLLNSLPQAHSCESTSSFMDDFPAHASDFKGRANYLNEIQAKFIEGNIIAIVGIDGVGKTEIAIKYAFNNKNEYQERCFFINAFSSDTLNISFANIAEKLGIQESNPKKRAVCVFRILANAKIKSLLVFDDAKNLNGIRGYLPGEDLANFFHIIITSNQDAWPEFEQIRLSLDDEAIQADTLSYIEHFLTRNNMLCNQAENKLLAEKFGYLPLGVAQALHYMHATKITINEYLAKYADYDHKVKLLNHGKDSHRRMLLLAWSMIYDDISNHNYSKKIADIYAYLSSQRLPKTSLKNHFQECDFDEAIAPLLNYFVVQKTGQGEHSFYSMHRTFQDVISLHIEKSMPKESRIEWLSDALNGWLQYWGLQDHPLTQALELVDSGFKYKRLDAAYAEQLRLMHHHAKSTLKHYQRLKAKVGFPTAIREKVCLLNYALGVYYLDAEYNIKLAKERLLVAEQMAGRLKIDRNAMARIYRQLYKAFLYNTGGNDICKRRTYIEKAEDYFKKYEAYIVEKGFAYYCDLARLTMNSIKYYANSTIESSFNNDSSNKFDKDDAAYLAAWKATASHRSKAEAHLENAKSKAETDQDWGLLYHYYGLYYLMLARMHKFPIESKKSYCLTAIDYFERSCERKLKAKDHREYARTVRNIAICYKQINNLDKAVEYYKLYFELKLPQLKNIYDIKIVDYLFEFAQILEARNNFEQAIQFCMVVDRILMVLGRKKIDNMRLLIKLYGERGCFDELKNYWSKLSQSDRAAVAPLCEQYLPQTTLEQYRQVPLSQRPSVDIQEINPHTILDLLKLVKDEIDGKKENSPDKKRYRQNTLKQFPAFFKSSLNSAADMEVNERKDTDYDELSAADMDVDQREDEDNNEHSNESSI